MSYIALYDDIRAKLAELAKTNSVAKAVSKEVEKRAANQEVFESSMADKIRAEDLITLAEHQRLGIIRDLRNKAAHPSGVHATPEEARFVYRTVISEFLSKQLLKTTHAVDAIIERLGAANMFPTTQINEIKIIATAEIAELHPSAYPYLITKLAEAAESTDSQTNTNAERFLVGLTSQRNPVLRDIIRSKVLVANAHNSDYAGLAGRLIAADPKLLETLSGENALRIKSLLVSSAKTGKEQPLTRLSHPAKQLAEMIQELGEDAILKDYGEFVDQVLERYPYASVLLEVLKEAPKIADTVISAWKSSAKSTTFDTANAFARALSDIDEVVADLLSDEEAFGLVVGVNKAADWGANRSKAVRNSQFSESPNLVEAAKRYIKKNAKAAATLVKAQTDFSSLEDFEETNFGSE